MNKFWAYLKTKQFLNNLLMALGTVVLIVMIIFFSLSFYTRHGEGIPVPQLRGMQVERAMSLLKDQGFDYKIDSVYVLDQVPGAVVEQDPEAGTNVKENRTIYLTVVTRLAPPVTLPDLEQYTYREAAATLANSGLKIGDTSSRPDIANHVLEVRFGGQVIKTGAKLPKGSKVDLVLGNGIGANEVDLPDFTNQDLDGVKFTIKQSNLTLGTITYQGMVTDSTNVVVIAQSPMKTDSATKVSIGTRINLTVAQGKKTNAPPQ
ncbi:MAG: PASTA domain-containing protein [Bacteroidota bacterium]|nr:PASTA domain-containing protein [Bacteroidota bacterium]